MTPAYAATYTGLTKRSLRDRRLADMERQRAGQSIEGPPRVRLSLTVVRYRKYDLDRWVASQPTLEAVA